MSRLGRGAGDSGRFGNRSEIPPRWPIENQWGARKARVVAAAFQASSPPTARPSKVQNSTQHRLERPFIHDMVIGMASGKITITLPADQLKEVRAHVAAGNAASVSAFVKHAVGIALHDAAGWREMLAEALQQTGGPLTEKERAWADGILAPQRGNRTSNKGKAA